MTSEPTKTGQSTKNVYETYPMMHFNFWKIVSSQFCQTSEVLYNEIYFSVYFVLYL